MLSTRLGALDETARGVVDQLAVCEPLAPDELISDVTASDLEALERAGLLRVVDTGPRHRLVLGHPLYGEALRADLPVLRRRAILLATAQRIETLGARRYEDARRIATWRLDAGGNPDPELLLQAARFARYAHDLPQVERLATVLWNQAPTAEVAVLLGEAHFELGHYREAETILSAPLPPDSPEHLLVQRAILRGQNLEWGLSDWRAALDAAREAQRTMGPTYADDLMAREGLRPPSSVPANFRPSNSTGSHKPSVGPGQPGPKATPLGLAR